MYVGDVEIEVESIPGSPCIALLSHHNIYQFTIEYSDTT